MRSFTVLVVAVAVAACSKYDPKTDPDRSRLEVLPFEKKEGSISRPRAEPNCDTGWRASATMIVDGDKRTIEFECMGSNGVLHVTELIGAGRRPHTENYLLDREDWTELWDALDRAGWRTLGTFANSDETSDDDTVELSITDGTTTASVTCTDKQLKRERCGDVVGVLSTWVERSGT